VDGVQCSEDARSRIPAASRIRSSIPTRSTRWRTARKASVRRSADDTRRAPWAARNVRRAADSASSTTTLTNAELSR
jgi:hypothetical protein